MGQGLHGSAKTTHAVRSAIPLSQATFAELAEQYDITPKTVMKWRKRVTVNDRPMGPRELRSTVFLIEEEALWAAFRKHTLLPLDDRLYTLQASLPHLTRPSLHRLFQRHDILSAHLAAFVDANRTTCGAVGEKMRDITQRGGISKAQAGPHPG